MPRKSAAAMAVVARTVDHRPPPPAELTPAQAEDWNRIVRRMPNEWFTAETHPLLTALVRHVDMARQLAKAVDQFELAWIADEGGLERLDQLLRLRDREHRAMISLARSLRLTLQARYPADKASRVAGKSQYSDGQPPWERHTIGDWEYVA